MSTESKSIEQLIEAEVEKRVQERLKEAVQQDPVKPGERVVKLGRSVFIRTVTHHYTGRITRIEDDVLVLEQAAWIADDGRFCQFLKNGALKEVEPFPGPVEIGRGAIIDISEWKHPLPMEQK